MEVCNRNRSSTQHQKYIHPAIERTYISFIQLAPKSFIWLSSYLDIGIHIQFRLIRSYVRSWVRFHCVHACLVCMPFTCSCVCCHAKPSRKKRPRESCPIVLNEIEDEKKKKTKNETVCIHQPITCKCEPRIGSMIINDQDAFVFGIRNSADSTDWLAHTQYR